MAVIAVLPGDGIGREIVPEAVAVLKVQASKYNLDLAFEEAPVGGAAIDACGEPLPAATLELCRASDAVLLGAMGGPKWDNLPVHLRPESGALLPLRKALGLFANLRPIIVYPELADTSPLKTERVQNTNLLVIRELIGGLYFGAKGRETTPEGVEAAFDTMYYTRPEIERIARLGFETARGRRKKLTSVDKHNVLETSRFWRQVVEEIAGEYPDVQLNHLYVDNAAMQLIRDPGQFDVIITENTFGDILTDEASMLAGSIGLLPSASIGGKTALYEPAHGSAPDIAGQGKANPLATILSAAMLLEHSFKEPQAAREIENAVGQVLARGYRTADIYREGTILVSTAEMGRLVRERLSGA